MPDLPPDPNLLIAVPSDRSWFDGRLMTAATQVRVRDVPLPAGLVTLAAPANPARVMVAFASLSSVIGNINIAPWPDPNNYSYGQLGSAAPLVYKLFDHFSLVTTGWYINNQAGATTVRVIELIRTEG